MNNTTDILLAHPDPETKQLTIHDDTLLDGDLHTIAAQIAKFESVKTVFLSGTVFSSGMIAHFFSEIGKIPAIQEVVLQDNTISYRNGTFAVENAKNLTDSEINDLFSAANSYRNLAALRFVNCSSKDKSVNVSRASDIYKVLWQHDTLSAVEFVQSSIGLNRFASSYLSENSLIHTVHFSSDNSFETTNTSYDGFYAYMTSQDRVASLVLPGDPWSHRVNPDKWLQDSKNLIEFRVLEFESDTLSDALKVKKRFPERLQAIQLVCERNRKQAENLLSRLESASLLTEGDVQGISQYLHAIMCLGDRKHGRPKMIEMLASFNERTAAELGQVCSTAPYYDHANILKQMKEAAATAEKKALAQAARDQEASRRASAAAERAEAEEAAKKFTGEHQLDQVIKNIPVTHTDEIKYNLSAIRTNAAELRNYGSDVVDIIGRIIPPALQIVTITPDLDPVAEDLGKIMDTVEGIKLILEYHSEGRITADFAKAGLVACTRQPVPFPTRQGYIFFSKMQLPDTVSMAHVAKQKISDFIKEYAEVARLVGTQLQVMDKVNTAFGRIQAQTSRVLEVGKNVLAEMKGEAFPDVEVTAAQKIYTTALESRLDFVDQTGKRFQATHGRYILHHGSIEQAFQLMSSFASSELPLLATTWETFAAHLGSSFDKDARHSKSTSSDRLLIATGEIEAIIRQISAIDQSLKIISDELSGAARNVPNLFPKASVVQSVIQKHG